MFGTVWKLSISLGENEKMLVNPCCWKTCVLGTAVAWSGMVTAYAVYQFLKGRRSSLAEAEAREAGQLCALKRQLAEDYARNDDTVLHPSVRAKLAEALLYHQKVATLVSRHFHSQNALPDRILVVGCGVGGLAFELSAFFGRVVAVDRSAPFIAACHQLKHYGRLVFSLPEEGRIMSEHIAVVDPLLDRTKVSFGHEDAENLPRDLGKFGCVFVGGALSQMKYPKRFLEEISEYISPRGFLTIALDYSQDLKARNVGRLGGYVDPVGKTVTGFRTLQQELKQRFQMVESSNMLRVSTLEQRVYELRVSHVTVWQVQPNVEDK